MAVEHSENNEFLVSQEIWLLYFIEPFSGEDYATVVHEPLHCTSTLLVRGRLPVAFFKSFDTPWPILLRTDRSWI